MLQTPPRESSRFSFAAEIIKDEFDPTAVEIDIVDLSTWEHSDKFCVMLHNVFSAEECIDIIRKTEEIGYEAALVNIGGGRQMLLSDVRNNDRCIIDDIPGVEKIWQRIRAIINAVPSNHKLADLMHIPWISPRGHRAVGLNERLRFLRYDAGTFFAAHLDGNYVRGNELGMEHKGETSFVTLQIYLNEGFDGGATRFKSNAGESDGYDIVPRTGSVLLFQHDCLHEGSLLVSGRKYAVRTDVMYSENAE